MIDPVIRSRIHYQNHTDTVTHVMDQPSENAILERNAELRKDNVLSDLSFGRQIASIPLIMWERAKRAGYDLESKDSKIAEKEIFRFLQSDLGKACMVRDKI
jgi:hypothetical protein